MISEVSAFFPGPRYLWTFDEAVHRGRKCVGEQLPALWWREAVCGGEPGPKHPIQVHTPPDLTCPHQAPLEESTTSWCLHGQAPKPLTLGPLGALRPNS